MIKIKKNIWSVCFLCALLATSHIASADDYTPAKAVIEKVLAKLVTHIENIQQKGDGNDKVYYDLALDIINYVDIESMATLSLGKKYWGQMDRQQRKVFLLGFRAMVISTYAKQGSLLQGIRFEFLPPTQGQNEGRYIIVKTKIYLQSKAPLEVNYALKKKGKDWKIFDFIVDGVSLIRQFRRNFGSEIKTGNLNDFVERIAAFHITDSKKQ